MSRHDLTDCEYNAIRHFLPSRTGTRRGRPWADHRQVLNGILWILHTGSPWRDLPAEFGKWQTVYNRFRRWVHEGLWDRIFGHLLRRIDALGHIDRSLWCVDGSVVRAHRAASGALPHSDENDEENALGRSRGGYSTKLHVMTDAQGTLLAVTVTAGQRNESTEFESLLTSCELSFYRQSKRPKALAGDKGYSSKPIRQLIKDLSINPVIPTRSNETTDENFDSKAYRRRNIVERAIGWLKESRRIATRYDKLVESYIAFIQIAALRRIVKLI